MLQGVARPPAVENSNCLAISCGFFPSVGGAFSC
jgi:hypothetical protein